MALRPTSSSSVVLAKPAESAASSCDSSWARSTMVRGVRRSSGPARNRERAASGPNARMTLPLAAQCAGERVPRDRLADLPRQRRAHRTRNGPEVRLAPDGAGQLHEAAAQAVLGSALVALDQTMALERRKQAKRGRAVDAELAGHLGPRLPAPDGKHIEDRHRPVHGADEAGVPTRIHAVAHGATLYVGVDCCWALSICWAMRNNKVHCRARRSAMSREEEIRAELFEHTLNGHAPEVKALTEEGLALHMDPMDILFKALIPSLEEVGRRFEKGDFFVPEMLIAARAMQGAL